MSELTVKNKAAIDEWLFNRANNMGHRCIGIKGIVNGESVNIKFIDEVAGDSIDVIYELNYITL